MITPNVLVKVMIVKLNYVINYDRIGTQKTCILID